MNRFNHEASGQGWGRSVCHGRYLDFLAAVWLSVMERGVRSALGMFDLLVLRVRRDT
jgi:hypothetical protein